LEQRASHGRGHVRSRLHFLGTLEHELTLYAVALVFGLSMLVAGTMIDPQGLPSGGLVS
jgi:hypothetical protein